MTDAFWQHFFNNLAPIIGAVFTGVVAVLMVFINAKLNNVRKAQDSIEKNTNGMTQQLIAEAEKRGYTKGQKNAVSTIKGANMPVTFPAGLEDETSFSQGRAP